MTQSSTHCNILIPVYCNTMEHYLARYHGTVGNMEQQQTTKSINQSTGKNQHQHQHRQRQTARQERKEQQQQPEQTMHEMQALLAFCTCTASTSVRTLPETMDSRTHRTSIGMMRLECHFWSSDSVRSFPKTMVFPRTQNGGSLALALLPFSSLLLFLAASASTSATSLGSALTS